MISPEVYRHDHPLLKPEVNDPTGGFYKIPHYELENYWFNCLATNGKEWEHVAVTICQQKHRPDRCPTWEEMCFIKSQFWEDEKPVMQLHPPKSQWVSNHPYCLHLWRPKVLNIPLPPSIMVGVKS